MWGKAIPLDFFRISIFFLPLIFPFFPLIFPKFSPGFSSGFSVLNSSIGWEGWSGPTGKLGRWLVSWIFPFPPLNRLGDLEPTGPHYKALRQRYYVAHAEWPLRLVRPSRLVSPNRTEAQCSCFSSRPILVRQFCCCRWQRKI